MSCAGAGGPTVIFDAGYGEDARAWVKVMPEVSRWTRAVAYDRAGLGRSHPRPGAEKVSSETLTGDLERLLDSASVRGPYVLVAHSLSGLHARLFAARRRGDVKGVVLVDPFHEDLLPRFQATTSPEHFAWWRATFPEAIERFDLDASTAQTRASEGLEGIPLVVLTATSVQHDRDLPPDAPPGLSLAALSGIVRALHEELARRSRRGRQILVDAGHSIHRDRPDVVINAIRDMVEAARSM
jgi:pimeloyl-ACP methyl ester carboxylesterase